MSSETTTITWGEALDQARATLATLRGSPGIGQLYQEDKGILKLGGEEDFKMLQDDYASDILSARGLDVDLAKFRQEATASKISSARVLADRARLLAAFYEATIPVWERLHADAVRISDV